MAFNLSEALKSLRQRLTATTIKPGETAQTLQERLGVGNIQFQQAQQAVKQGTGAFVPTTKPLTLGASGQLVQTGVPGIPPGTQPISTQPQPLTITPQQLQPKPITQPTTGGIVTVGPGAKPITPTTAVQGIQQQVSGGVIGGQQAIDLQKQIDETKARLKEAQGQQKALQTVEAMGGKVVMPGEEKPAEPTGFEKYAETIRDAIKPVTEAYKGYIDELRARPSVAAEFQRLLTEKGLPQFSASLKDIMAKAQGVEAQLEQLPEDVKRRVQDFVVTQRQYERVTSAEAKPLTSLYNALSRTYEAGTAEYNRGLAEIQTYMGLVDKDTEMKMKALEVGLGVAKFGAETEVGLAKAGFEAEAEAIKEGKKAPTVIGSAEVGYWQWNPETKTFEKTVEPTPEKPKTTSDITNYQFYVSQEKIAGRTPKTFGEWQETKKPEGRMTASTIDPQTMNDLLYDLEQGAGLSQLYTAYPEVSPALIQSIYYNR